MNSQQRWRLGLLVWALALGLGPSRAGGQAPSQPGAAPPASTNAPTRSLPPWPRSASEVYAADQKARQDEKNARDKAAADLLQRHQDEKARLEMERQKELKRIELEI